MADELYGVLEAQRRCREWMPHLKTNGQTAVYGALLTFFSMDGTATPSYPQIAELVRMHPSSVRKILGQLEELGALMRVGERPRLDSRGIAHGARLVIWSIPTRASEGAGGVDSQARPNAIPSAPKRGSKRALRGAPLKVEKLRGSKEPKTDPSPERNNPKDCSHQATDDEGYCAGCLTQVVA